MPPFIADRGGTIRISSIAIGAEILPELRHAIECKTTNNDFYAAGFMLLVS
jgi:hypothetical protein